MGLQGTADIDMAEQGDELLRATPVDSVHISTHAIRNKHRFPHTSSTHDLQSTPILYTNLLYKCSQVKRASCRTGVLARAFQTSVATISVSSFSFTSRICMTKLAVPFRSSLAFALGTSVF